MVSNKTSKKTLAQKFLEYANPDEDGFSTAITIDELVNNVDPKYRTTNGGDWCRNDGQLKTYNITKTYKGGRIDTIKLDGFNKYSKRRSIKASIRKQIVSMPCVVLATNSSVECDHKDGKYDDSNVADIESQQLTDFQPLSKSANVAKRTHCNQCIDTGIRFDAKRLGYKESYLKGDAKTKSCSGCYWYDPKKFNETISKDYKKDL